MTDQELRNSVADALAEDRAWLESRRGAIQTLPLSDEQKDMLSKVFDDMLRRSN